MNERTNGSTSQLRVLVTVFALLFVATVLVKLVRIVLDSTVLAFLLVTFQHSLVVSVASAAASFIALVACRGRNKGHGHFESKPSEPVSAWLEFIGKWPFVSPDCNK